jgi:hypothetical protein
MALKQKIFHRDAIIKDQQYVLFKLIKEEYSVVILRFHGIAQMAIKLMIQMNLLFFQFKINASLKFNRVANKQFRNVEIGF